jgi:serine/threonine-protein kinase
MLLYYPQQAVAQTTTRNNFTTYENPTDKIKIEYPSNWTKKENISVDNVVAFRPPPDMSGKYAAGLGIYVHKLPVADISLEDYSIMQADYLRNQSFTILKSNNTTLAHQPGNWVKYETHVGSQALEVWTIKGDKAYVIVYLAEKGKYTHYLPAIQTMIYSFEIESNISAQSAKAIKQFVCKSPSSLKGGESFCK